MKIRISYILFAATLFFATEGFAQVNRSIGQSQYRNSLKKNNKKPDFVIDALAYLTKELKLDGFQEAAVKEILLQNKALATELMENKEMKANERRDKSYALSMKIYEEASPLLSKEQIEKYKGILKLEKEERTE